jgi:hypothetical protein
MDCSSTLLVWCVFVGLTIGLVLGRYALQPKPPQETETQAYLRQQAVRLAAAQRWARAGVCSEPGEIWRPIMTACAIAALCVRTRAELLEALTAAEVAAGPDNELAAPFAIARAEVENAVKDWDPEFLLGNAEGPLGWNYPRLRSVAGECIHAAMVSARGLLKIRRTPSDAPPAANS